jgi:transcriptional regulator with XRE-family HTH domain
MLTLEEIRERLIDRRLPIVAKATGLGRKTLWEIREGRVTNPSYRVLKTLSDYLTEDK